MTSERFTQSDVAVLQAARAVLTAAERRARDAEYELRKAERPGPGDVDGYDLGRFGESAVAAEEAIFNAINTAQAYCHCPVSREALAKPTSPAA